MYKASSSIKWEKEVPVVVIGGSISWEPTLPIDINYRDAFFKKGTCAIHNANYCLANGFFNLRDDIWSATFGAFQEQLDGIKQSSNIIIDFSRISWIDPLPLLALSTSLRVFIEATQSNLLIKLGILPEDDFQRGAFLRFIAEHHFLRLFLTDKECYSGTQEISFGDENWSISSIYDLEQKLTILSYKLTYDDSMCLRAKIHNTNDENEKNQNIIVKEYLQEINDNALVSIFEKRPDLIAPIIHKLRVILSEIVNNAYSHAFTQDCDEKSSRYFAIYIRIRKRSCDTYTSNKLETAIRQEQKYCPTFKHCSINQWTDWIEIFYYDPGKGLLADIPQWQALAKKKKPSDRAEFENKILGIKSTTNVLHLISKLLFSQPVSAFSRENKTALTGLQHIGLTLANNLDFARILVNREWAGSPHPWESIQADGVHNIGKRHPWDKLPHTKGTAWHFCVALETHDFQLPEYWVDAASIKKDNSNINRPVSHGELKDYFIIDERKFDQNQGKINITTLSFKDSKLIWLPEDITKQYIKKYVSHICGTPELKPIKNNVSTWIIADLSAFPASIVAQIIQSEWVDKEREIDIYILSQNWQCCCLEKDPDNNFRLKFNSKKALIFLKSNILRFFRMLRHIDSNIFWSQIPSNNPALKDAFSDTPFVYEEVFWEGSDGSKSKLLGYLDLSQALTTPSRKAVCQRALLRTWHFFAPGSQLFPSDTLLTGLLPDETIIQGDKKDNTSKPIVHVGSVLASGSTVSRKLRRFQGTSLHLFRHGHIKSEDPKFKGWADEPVALEWMRVAPVLLPPPPDTLPYERIPGTPFIGRGGAKTIPIRRFKRPQNPQQRYFSPELSFYGEPPQEMYDHFLLCGAIKIGHWQYGGHHDLFTLNLGKIYRLEHNSKGPLVDWLVNTLKSINRACMLIYPSHPVTDNIIRDLQLKFADCLPRQIIPVNYLAEYSQSSIRIPSLTYDRIRRILESQTESSEIILFDDGIISGKVARELEQLIRNANIHGRKLTIHLVTLVTRTGLPLYRRLMEATKDHNHHFWRWDVPALGNRRMCPLCNALGNASLLCSSFPDGEAKKQIKKWINQWECKDVETDWESHGINPRPLPHIREMTFGKEWIPGEDAVAYEVKHSTTTGLAAMVVELLRITSYRAVGLQIADEPWGKKQPPLNPNRPAWKHASFEILIGQILLFFDDFDFDELTYRYERLFILLIQYEYDDEICSLARLTLLLARPDHAVFILKSSRNILTKKEIHNLDGLITLGDLQAKCIDVQPSLISEIKEKDESTNNILRKNLNYSWYIFSGIEQNPYYKQRNAFRMLILLLGDSKHTMHHGYLHDRLSPPGKANVSLIIRDLQLINTSLSNIRKEMYVTSPRKSCLYSDDIYSFNIDEFISGNLGNIDKMSMILGEASEVNKEKEILLLSEWLFGENVGLAVLFQNNFLASPVEILQEINSKITISDWKELIEKKSKNNPELLKRWKKNIDSLTPPKIEFKVEEDYSQIIVCPPIVRQFIRDIFLNVIHSSEELILENDHKADMLCNVNITNENIVFTFSNYTLSKKIPVQGIVSSIIDDFFQKDFVSYKVENNNDAQVFITTVVIPTVKAIGERNG